ncbi:MAG: UDP-N-acetylenolpyruvoylglucosamine reductase [Candidatus Portnoybacteria bacterium RIFCSPLOWO2_01_FULL_43_11]|uniref:UDP-N-acetylenolpyruvoylglucosamine reductase n=4 Tax=Bacteria candidate phyla TaxID=1783234 RepID=A0A1G2FRZ4_9BACT|nr:MAG: UDP-N-acetylenolpyruvoylglucosamine reductase [candidate division WWE3 bacterium RIFCSPHIGHO2_01_FULL_35_17]OGZ37747.1 MAG: UDP-N-acetylenolpyruvoylglucosamine reductase [Candidatus Portnoybacteria bacterium RIFCSPHIGHO2_12_FULL_40_11]OGZ38118.1 MAG: UDP-N-acetylenolpyruvoylglucosamine reductase [Candidatus Portnoybacteria bacterium RIFCSPLOWO2_01_FULL_43_11]OGZ40856.1 MAG: UDP-N-acetylenolpyruvoylglucosamine reductase [Candidatus Portnoybacteria bacterium RIFCSPLOWO2_02_FULL_40_15]
MNIQKNIPLVKYTTFRIGGPARYFITAKSAEDLIEAVRFAKAKKLPYFILGGGSNLLVSDEGFNGVIIKNQNSKIKIQNYNSKFKIIQAEAGVNLGKLVRYSAKQGLTGLEWAIGVPGTLGGAIRGNAGAFGHSVSEFIKEVKSLNSKLQVISYKLQDLNFGYRDSIFKKNKEIILSVILKLKKGVVKEIKKEIKETVVKRNIPPFPSAGSVFKNLLIKNLDKNILAIIPEEKIKEGKIAAGYLIDQCGLKGKKIGRAMILEKHANFIVNLGPLRRGSSEASGAKAKDVIKLIQLIKKTVQKKFKIKLEEEIEYLGFD